MENTTILSSADRQILQQAAQIMEKASSYTSALAFTDCSTAKRYFTCRLLGEEREHFEVVYLNTQHQFITTERLFSGTIDGASVYPREVVRAALLHNASAIILAHNHPSGVTTPSDADRNITKRVQEACRLLDIRLLDHIIIGRDVKEAYSMVEEGDL